MITPLATISFALWGLVAALMVTTVIRIYRGQSRPGDEWRVVSLFFAIMIMGFNGRRAFGINDAVLRPLYWMSMALAAYIVVLRTREWWRDRAR